MKNWFWVEKRLGWPLVASIVFFTVSLIAVDLVWRIANAPFETLLLYAVLADGGLAAAIVLVYRMCRRRA